MVTTTIACCVAGICVLGFIAIWFSTVYRELSERRRSLNGLREQLQLHRTASAQAGMEAEREVARKMLSTNQSIFRETAERYNQLLKRPQNRLPALLMGFRPMDEAGMEKRQVKKK